MRRPPRSRTGPTLRRPASLLFTSVLCLAFAACSGSSRSGSGAGTTATLAVSPPGGLDVGGFQGGPFSPASKVYTLSNTGAAELEWTVTMDAQDPWVTLSPVAGTLAPGEEAQVTVSIDQAQAALLQAGLFPVVVDFNNETNGRGSTSRGLNLTVASIARVELEPDEEFRTAGDPGGPFTPKSKIYILTNVGEDPVTWTASASQPWVRLSGKGGTIQPGVTAILKLSVDPARAAALPLGNFGADVKIDVSPGNVPLSIEAGLTVQAAGPAMADSLTQFGVTWAFDREYEVGQFANGDWWVVGPVRIVDVQPESGNTLGFVQNGSMINPTPRAGRSQGYDSSMYAQYQVPGNYQPGLNVAPASAGAPLVLPPQSSLVSTVSRSEPGLRPQLFSAAVLTVLDAPAPAGSFRPPYCGRDKTIRFHVDQLRRDKLASLAPVASTPPMLVVERWFERPWIDHVPDWPGRYTHPLRNMPDYGREICDQIGTAALMLHLDFPEEEKETLLIRLVQVGIDFFGIVQDGGNQNWLAGGGHHSGRKWPILFAGLMLDDPDMTAIGFDDSVAFNEDDQTFYVQETSSGVYNYGQGGYQAQHVGMPEWGGQHWKQINRGQPPTFDDVRWFADPYRLCCTAHVWWGEILAARIMGARSLWNHDALFDYLDRYRAFSQTTGQAPWTIGWTTFPLEMWDTYRDDYP